MNKKSQNTKNVSIIKRFVGNKNTVTILGIVACIATLVIGYNYRVKVAISPISIPYAKVNIPSRTQIKPDMVGKLKIASSYTATANNLITSADEVINKYASYRTSIPKGSLFYNELVNTAEEMPDAAFANIEDGYTIYSLAVNKESTYANSIRAGSYIDLYLSAKVQSEVIFARLIESIRVLAVKNSRGENILYNSQKDAVPSELLFAVPDDMYELLMEAEFVNLNIKITPVLRNANYTNQANETQVSSEYLKSYILDNVTELG